MNINKTWAGGYCWIRKTIQ